MNDLTVLTDRGLNVEHQYLTHRVAYFKRYSKDEHGEMRNNALASLAFYEQRLDDVRHEIVKRWLAQLR